MPAAARVSDYHTCPMVTNLIAHVGGPLLPPGAAAVLIGGMPAATIASQAVCVGSPDIVVAGSSSVLISGIPAARVGDSTAHGGLIIGGEPTVFIGG